MQSTATGSGGIAPAGSPIKVMIVDDSAVVRGLVSRWIEEEPGLEAVARHANGRLAVEDVARSAPDIILLDIEMPVMDGLEALPLLLRARPDVRVLVVSTLTKRNAEISFKALSLGALDYLPKPDSNREITTSLDFRSEVIRKIKALGGCAQPERRRSALSRQRPGKSPARLHAAAILPRAAAHRRHRQLDRRPASAGRPARSARRLRSPGSRWWWRSICRRCSPPFWPSVWGVRPGGR